MIARVTPFAIGLAIAAVPAGASSAAGAPRIAFATNRAQNLYRSAIYSVRPDGHGRRLEALPSPPVTSVVRSRDGSRILLVRAVDGVYGLFVARPSGAEAVRIGPEHAGEGVDLTRSAFSPDATKVAFTAYTGCGYRCSHQVLYVVNVDGSGLERIDDPGSDPSWAPDSRRLVYAGSRATYVFDTRARTRRKVAHGHTYRPLWAPRGNRIAYLVSQGYAVLCFVQADGTRRRCLPGRSSARVVWSPDARRVALQLQGKGYRLAVVGADARGLRVFGGERDSISWPLAWSPDGRRVAYSSGRPGPEQIFVRPADGSQRPTQVTREAPATFLGDVRWRSGRISYAAHLGNNDLELAVAEGSSVRILTHNVSEDRQPDWSPDGRTIVFSRAKEAGGSSSSTLRLIDSSGRNDRPLTGAGRWRDTDPAWSPDGSRIAFIRMDSDSISLMVVDRDGTGLRSLMSPVLSGGVSWSPDGGSLVVTAPAAFQALDLFVVAADGSASRRLASWRDRPTAPAWSPDGTRVLFAAEHGPAGADDRPDLLTIRLDGTGLTRVAERVSFTSPGGSWSPDGSSVAFVRGGDRSSYPPTTRIVVADADGRGEVDAIDDASQNVDPAWSP
jgi:Tol biopolymer transport system component